MRFRSIKYIGALSAPLSVAIAFHFQGGWSYFGLIYAFVIIPSLELIFPQSEENYTKAEEEMVKQDKLYDLLIYSIVPIQYGLLFWFLMIVSSSISAFEIVGLVFSFGTMCSVLGINVAHELGHRNTWHEKLMSKMLLLTSLYMHFIIEHNRGHHKNVSTDDDPASARYGEIIYFFWIRSVFMGYFSAWKLEATRLKKSNRNLISIYNEMIWFTAIQGGLLAAITIVLSWQVMLLFVASAVIGFLLLETVNYIEHYGLRRKKVGEKRYEKVLPVHSWNSNHPVGRIVLFELTRHSDHHYHAGRKYQTLRHFEESPQMPTGYPGMMVISLFPPLWFYVMHRHIKKYQSLLNAPSH